MYDELSPQDRAKAAAALEGNGEEVPFGHLMKVWDADASKQWQRIRFVQMQSEAGKRFSIDPLTCGADDLMSITIDRGPGARWDGPTASDGLPEVATAFEDADTVASEAIVRPLHFRSLAWTGRRTWKDQRTLIMRLVPSAIDGLDQTIEDLRAARRNDNEPLERMIALRGSLQGLIDAGQDEGEAHAQMQATAALVTGFVDDAASLFAMGMQSRLVIGSVALILSLVFQVHMADALLGALVGKCLDPKK